MKYFSYISMNYREKNKLDKAVAEYLKTVNRIVISEPDLFKRMVLDVIKKLNEEHPRCKPVSASWYMVDGDCILSGVSVVNFQLYAAKN